MHFMKLKDKPFELIRDGKKTIELRLYDEKRRMVAVGDEIEFTKMTDETQKITIKVVALHLFDSFESLYKSLPLEKCGYDGDSIKTASAADMNEYYSIEEQQKYGVVGIEFEKQDRLRH